MTYGQVAMVRWIISKPYFQELRVQDPAEFFARQAYLERVIFLHYCGTGPAGQYGYAPVDLVGASMNMLKHLNNSLANRPFPFLLIIFITQHICFCNRFESTPIIYGTMKSYLPIFCGIIYTCENCWRHSVHNLLY